MESEGNKRILKSFYMFRIIFFILTLYITTIMENPEPMTNENPSKLYIRGSLTLHKAVATYVS